MLAAIEGLPEEDREVFELVRLQGLSHAEAAGVVGVAVKTVQRIQRLIQNRIAAPGLRAGQEFRPPWFLRVLTSVPLLRNLPARMMAFGPRRGARHRHRRRRLAAVRRAGPRRQGLE